MKFFLMLVVVCMCLAAYQAKTIQLHSDAIDDVVLFEGKIYTASFDGTIKQFDPKTGNIRLIGKVSDWVRSIVIKDGLVISGDNQGYIRAWDQHGKMKWEIKAHDWWITDMEVWGDQLITVSMDEYVKIWDIKSRKLLFEEKVNGSYKHQCISVRNNIAYIGSTAVIVFLQLNKDHFTVGRSDENSLSVVYLSCIVANDKTIFGLSDGRIYINGPTSFKTLNVHQGAIKALQLQNQMLYTGSDDGTIKQIDLKKLSQIKTIYHGESPVRSLIVTDKLIYAGFEDGTLKILKYF